MKYSHEFLDRVSAACHQAALDGRLRHRPAIAPEDDPHFQAAIREAKAAHAATRRETEAEADADDAADAASVPKLG